MNIRYHRQFLKHFQKRISPYPKLEKKFKKQLALWLADPQNRFLRDHRLAGQKSEFRSFSISSDIRVIYRPGDNEVQFYDIGSHNQVY